MFRTALIVLAGTVYGSQFAGMTSRELKGANWAWIRTDPLHEVAARLLAISYVDSRSIDSISLALLARRLVASEVTAGGPYKDIDGRVDIVTNIVIAQLFTQIDHLPQSMADFIQNNRYCESRHASSGVVEWLLFWPITLIPTTSKHAVATGVSMKPRRSPAAHVMAEIRTLKEPLRSEAYAIWESTNRANKNLEITHLATFFAQSIDRPAFHKTDSFYQNLGEANFYAWMAYTIYDDFLDDEGRKKHLSVANAMHRRSLLLYSQCAPTSIVPGYYFDEMDEANAWELAHCRADVSQDVIEIVSLPDYGTFSILARRASAHILGPLIVAALGANQDTFRSVERGLRHYLIARQLNDDLHDWQEDLVKGHLSPVVSHLLEKAGFTHGQFAIAEILPTLRQSFWHESVGMIGGSIVSHIQKSREYLQKDEFMTDRQSPFFVNVLDPIEASVRESLTHYSQRKKFLDTYRQS